MNYWDTLAKFIRENEMVVDRPKGSRHPRYPDVVYPLDYGYLANTSAIDGSGIDIFIGTLRGNTIQGIICSADDFKRDAEIKIMYNCSKEEIRTALDFLNKGSMRSIFIRKSE